jgi:PAS domain S-box-containing protein
MSEGDLLDHLGVGIARFDSNNQLTLASQPLHLLLGLEPAALTPGMTLRAVLERIGAAGVFGRTDPATAIALELGRDRRQPHRSRRMVAEGRLLQIDSRPLPDGGWLIEIADITAQQRLKEQARLNSARRDVILETLPVGVMVMGPDLRLSAFNTAAQEIYGAVRLRIGERREDLARRRAEAGVYGAGDVAELAAANLNPLDTGPFHLRRVQPDGRVVEIRSAPLPDGGYVRALADITALVAAEAEAGRRAAAMQAMLANMRHGIGLYDRDRRLLAANPLFFVLSGLPADESALGASFEALVERQAASGAFGAPAIAAAVTAELLAMDRSRPHRYQRQRPNGDVVEVCSDPTPDGGFIISLSDVSPLVRAEREAQQRAALLQAILDNIQHGIAAHDAGGRLVVANALAEELCGLRPGEMRPGLLQADLIRLQHARGAYGTGAAAETFMRQGLARDWHRPARFQRRAGDSRVIDVTVNPMPDGGYVLGWSDITALLKAEAEAARRTAMLQAMLDHLWHGIALFDREHRLVAFNELAATYTGIPSDPGMIGATFADITRRQLAEGSITPEAARRTLEDDRRLPQRGVRFGPNGEVLEARSGPLPDGGFVVSLTDVTPLARAEAAARHRAELLQVTLDHMRHGFVKYDSQRRLEMVNALALRLHGLPEDMDLLGQREPDIVHLLWQRGEVDEAAWRGSVAADIATHRQTVRTRANGQVVLFTADPTPDGGYVVTVSDISELAAAETEARQRAAILEVMLDNTRHGIICYGPDRRVIAANRLAARLGGYRDTTLALGTTIDELIEQQNAAGVLPPDQMAVAQFARDMDRSRPSRYSRRTSDGRVIEVTSDPTPDGGFVVTSTDITRLVAAETEARQRAAILEVMLDNIRHGIVLFGADSRLVTANPAVPDLLGVPATLIQPGMHYRDYAQRLAATGALGGDPAAEEARLLASFDPQTPTRRLRRMADGRTLERVSDPTPGGGFVLVYTDVTEDRRIRAELEAARSAAEVANQAKSRFLATMSHELRTPLNAVIGFSEALQTAPDKQRAAEYLRAIHEAGRHLLALIDDILDVTRAETTGFQIAESEVAVAALCEGSVRVMQAAAAAAGVHLQMELAPRLPSVRADPVRLRQVLLNLLSNAVKFTPAEGSVTLAAAVEQDGALAFTVRDTGIGLKAEDIPRAFEPFTQLDSSYSRRFPGSGLGLYLSRALAEAQGASLSLTPGEGGGTLAVLRFPPDRLV